MKYSGILLLLLALKGAVYGQGCSDAGFCTAGVLQNAPLDSIKEKRNKLSLLFTNGVGDQNVYVFTPGLQYERQVNSQLAVQAKFTGNYASGDLGTAAGAGDLLLTSSYVFRHKRRFKHASTLGLKIPLDAGDLRNGQRPLPMQYQSSLGTWDLIVGYKLSVQKWSVNLGWQHPLSGKNKNTFLPDRFGTPAAYAYPPSNAFERKGDLLVRLAYQFVSQRNWNWNGSVLGIYHLGEDRYSAGPADPTSIPILGSEGLTVNITSLLTYQINKRVLVGVSGGVPVLVRQVRPDGLTRAFALTPEIQFNF